MLDTNTKRRIDSCRDILVGKVPDPKSQVEQITIALIYKFMDDMDRQSVEMGGNPSFFTGDYKKYAWSKIFDPKLGGFELIALYGEALVEMNHNPKIPQLFRDIFKNAFLPYRDPETLKSFLKEINTFSYDHSEKLGDAFEYLLSVLGSQGEAGQFRTPRHIIDFIVEVVAPQKNEMILDPACGTAGFLIAAYKHIVANNKKLSATEKKKMIRNFVGYDISPDMVRLSLVNMYLHGFVEPHIFEYDTLTSEERWDDKADVILANPPFMSPKGGIKPHKRFSIPAKRSEVLFVDYIAEHLTPQGRAGVIVPEGIIFQSQNAYKDLRKMLIEQNYLWAVVSMPAGVFNPYSGVKTSILLMDRQMAKKTDKILFVKVENDGFNLGAQRREIEGGQLLDALDFINRYKTALASGKQITDGDLAHTVTKEEILASADISLSGERYRDFGQIGVSEWPMVPLAQFMKQGVKTIDPRKSPEEPFELWSIPAFDTGQPDLLIGKDIGSQKKMVVPGDVLLSRIIPHIRRCCVIEENQEKRRQVASTEWIIFASKEIIPKYLKQLLVCDRFHTSFMQTITGVGGSLSRANPKAVGEIKIPLPPLEVQEIIVAEVGGYQKVIDGARQVVEHYKPTIKINPDWPMMELGGIFRLSSGQFLPSSKQNDGPYKIYGGNGVLGYHNEYSADNPTLIIGRVGAYCGAVHITDSKSWITDNALYVTEYLKEIEQGFLALLLKQLNLNQYAKVGGQPSISQTTLYSLKIPLPPLKEQQTIVAEIEAEQAIVAQNKKLIELFETKIQTTIAAIWGNK